MIKLVNSMLKGRIVFCVFGFIEVFWFIILNFFGLLVNILFKFFYILFLLILIKVSKGISNLVINKLKLLMVFVYVIIFNLLKMVYIFLRIFIIKIVI